MQIKLLVFLVIILLLILFLTSCNKNDGLQSLEVNTEVLGIGFYKQFLEQGYNPTDFLPFNPLTQEVRFTPIRLVESNTPIDKIRKISLSTLKEEGLYDASFAIDEGVRLSYLQHYEAFEQTLKDFHIKPFQIDGVEAGFYYLEINKDILGLEKNELVTERMIRQKPESITFLSAYSSESFGGFIPDIKMSEIFTAAKNGKRLYHLYGTLYFEFISTSKFDIQSFSEDDKPVLVYTDLQTFRFMPRSHIPNLYEDFKSFRELDFCKNVSNKTD